MQRRAQRGNARGLQRPQPGADPGLLEIVDDDLGDVGVGRIAIVVAGIETALQAGLREQPPKSLADYGPLVFPAAMLIVFFVVPFSTILP